MSDNESRKVGFKSVFSASNPEVPLPLHDGKNTKRMSQYGYTSDYTVPGNDVRQDLTTTRQNKKFATNEYARELENGISTDNNENLIWKRLGNTPILALIGDDGNVIPLDAETIKNTSKNERQTIFKTLSDFFAKMYGYEGGKKSKSRKNRNVKKRKTIRRRK